VNEHNITKLHRTSQYEVCTDRINFITCFVPSDLVRETENSFSIINGLEGVFDKRKKVFLYNLEKISELRRKFISCSVMPDYTEIYEKDNIPYAKSRYYYTDKFSSADSRTDFFHKIFLICRFMKNMVNETGIEPVIELDDIVFEKNISRQIHILYADIISDKKSPLCIQVRNMMIHRLYGRKPGFSDNICNRKINISGQYHPEISRLLNILLDSLNPCRHTPSDWNISFQTAEKICDLMKKNEDYLMYPYKPEKTKISFAGEAVRNAFEKNGHVVFLHSNKKELLYRLADSYINETCGKYLHIAAGSAENGLQNMFESRAFTFNSGKKSANDCISSLKNMCRYGCLLIIENCDVENDGFFKNILRLPADILILTRRDYSEYSFCILNF